MRNLDFKAFALLVKKAPETPIFLSVRLTVASVLTICFFTTFCLVKP
jgi:hypothetical protein